MTSLPSAVVADANVVLSALIGGRARLVFALPLAPACIAPKAVADEVARHLPRLSERRGLDASLLFAALSVIPVAWETAAADESRREDARRRMGERDPDDWPMVALALARSLPLWSQTRQLGESCRAGGPASGLGHLDAKAS